MLNVIRKRFLRQEKKIDIGEHEKRLRSSPIYADVLVVTFSYTMDTQNNDGDSIQNAIRRVENHSLTWLVNNLLPCGASRRLSSSLPTMLASQQRATVANRTQRRKYPKKGKCGEVKGTEDVAKKRGLRSDSRPDLGIVGFSSWPIDEVSTLGKY